MGANCRRRLAFESVCLVLVIKSVGWIEHRHNLYIVLSLCMFQQEPIDSQNILLNRAEVLAVAGMQDRKFMMCSGVEAVELNKITELIQ